MKLNVSLTEAQARALLDATGAWWSNHEGERFTPSDRSTAVALENGTTAIVRALRERKEKRRASTE